MNIKDLEVAFKERNVPHKGVIAIYGNYFGKPGDTIAIINDIMSDGNKIEFFLKDMVISIISPEGISFSENSISIKSSLNTFINESKLEAVEGQDCFNLYCW